MGLVFAGIGAGGIAGFRLLLRAFHRDAALREQAERQPGATVPPQGSAELMGPVLFWIGAGFVLTIVGPGTFWAEPAGEANGSSQRCSAPEASRR
jgi:hypothetical protein